MDKRVRLSPSEKKNADENYPGRLYTVVARPGAKTGQTCRVSAVYVDDGRIIQSVLVQSPEGVPDAIREILNTMDSWAQDGKMAQDARQRLASNAASARLAAAAPELLAALQALVAGFESDLMEDVMFEHDMGCGGEGECELCTARAVIKKVTGTK